MQSVIVVGASLAGLRAAETLRRDGFTGRIDLIGDEPHAPYDRPPLSKQVLSGEWDHDRVWLSSDEKLSDLDITLHLGDAAVGLDAATRTVTLASGAVLQADGVVIATGARARTIGPDRAGVHTLRTLEDATAIRAALAKGPKRVVVVGAGFIGAEVAATARGLGIAVSMVEAAPVPFERSLGVEMGAVLADVHRDHGVDLRLGVGCDEILGDESSADESASDQQVTGVRLSDGSTIAADLVVVGIGVIPNTEWLEGSGLTIDNGVVCDASSLAAPGIVAAGDVARWPNDQFGDTMRVEHWDNATTQGVFAAQRLLAESSPEADAIKHYSPVPWFWSDQYDRKIQLAGRTTDYDTVQVVNGSLEERKFAAIYGRRGVLVAVLGFNRPRHVMRYRSLIEAKASFDEALAADF